MREPTLSRGSLAPLRGHPVGSVRADSLPVGSIRQGRHTVAPRSAPDGTIGIETIDSLAPSRTWSLFGRSTP